MARTAVTVAARVPAGSPTKKARLERAYMAAAARVRPPDRPGRQRSPMSSTASRAASPRPIATAPWVRILTTQALRPPFSKNWETPRKSSSADWGAPKARSYSTRLVTSTACSIGPWPAASPTKAAVLVGTPSIGGVTFTPFLGLRSIPAGSIARGPVPTASPDEPARLLAVGVSHRHAPLELRERLYLADGHAVELAQELGAVVLSTCNRTEIYLAGGDPEVAREQLERSSGLELGGVLATWEGGETVEHLFRVAAGLDSLVPGEAEILGQVRLAYEAALNAGATGPALNRLFEDALHA